MLGTASGTSLGSLHQGVAARQSSFSVQMTKRVSRPRLSFLLAGLLFFSASPSDLARLARSLQLVFKSSLIKKCRHRSLDAFPISQASPWARISAIVAGQSRQRHESPASRMSGRDVRLAAEGARRAWKKPSFFKRDRRTQIKARGRANTQTESRKKNNGQNKNTNLWETCAVALRSCVAWMRVPQAMPSEFFLFDVRRTPQCQRPCRGSAPGRSGGRPRRGSCSAFTFRRFAWSWSLWASMRLW